MKKIFFVVCLLRSNFLVFGQSNLIEVSYIKDSLREEYHSWSDASKFTVLPDSISYGLTAFYDKSGTPEPIRRKYNILLKMCFNTEMTNQSRIFIIDKLINNHKDFSTDFPVYILLELRSSLNNKL
jgi:hypothetical protein